MHAHELWLTYADNDLKTAKIAFQEDAILSSAFFLTQQSAEKALKAFLIYHKRHIRKIHDLVELLKECINIDQCFDCLKKEANGLNPFVVKFRYPDVALPFPDKTTLAISIQEAEKILTFVKNSIELHHCTNKSLKNNQSSSHA